MKLYLKHVATGNMYEIVGTFEEKGKSMITLKDAEMATTFNEPYDKEHLKNLGYQLVKDEAA